MPSFAAALLMLSNIVTAAAAPAVHVVGLHSQSSAGIHGAATLTPLGSKTKVSISLLNDPRGAEHPAHIHSGTCQTFNPLPSFPLRTVKAGTSVTIVNAPITDLLDHGLVLEVHSSKYHVLVIAACGALATPASK